MPTEFLTDAQERAYGHYVGPPSNQQLAGYFHLDDAELDLVNVRRGAYNKLGFALQLTTAQFLGTFLTEPTAVPPNVIAYVAAQLGIHDVVSLAEYGARSNTAWEHAVEIRRVYGYRDFSGPAVWFPLVRWLYTRAERWYQPCPKRDEIPIDGDGTVPVLSATMSDPWLNNVLLTDAELSYVQREHTALVKRDGADDGPGLAWIGATLAQSSRPAAPAAGGLAVSRSEPVTLAGAPSVTRTPANQLSGTWISALGPVALRISNANGRTTGRSRGSVSGNAAIPDTSYDRLPDAEFTFIKRDMAYTLDLIAEREGSLDLKVRVLGNGRVERTAVYLGVALGSRGHARLSVRPGTGRAASPAGWPRLEVDADGDGTFEASVPAAAVLDAVHSADTRAPELAIDSPRLMRSDSGPVTVGWRAADPGAGLLLESAVIDPDTTPRTVTQGERVSLSSGQHNLVVVAVDRAGNARTQDATFVVP